MILERGDNMRKDPQAHMALSGTCLIKMFRSPIHRLIKFCGLGAGRLVVAGPEEHYVASVGGRCPERSTASDLLLAVVLRTGSDE